MSHRISNFILSLAIVSLPKQEILAFKSCEDSTAAIASRNFVSEAPDIRWSTIHRLKESGSYLSLSQEQALGEQMIESEKRMLPKILDSDFALRALKALRERLKVPTEIRQVLKFSDKDSDQAELNREQNELYASTIAHLEDLISNLDSYRREKSHLVPQEQLRRFDTIVARFFEIHWARMYYNQYLLRPILLSDENETNQSYDRPRPEERVALLARIQADIDARNIPKEKLLIINLGLAFKEVKKFTSFQMKNGFGDGLEDEAISAASENLMRAADYYEPSYGYRFSSNATTWAKAAIHGVFRSKGAKKLMQTRSLSKTIGDSNLIGASVVEDRPSSSPEGTPLEHQDQIKKLRRIIKSLLEYLSPEEIAVLKGKFGLTNKYEYYLAQDGTSYSKKEKKDKSDQARWATEKLQALLLTKSELLTPEEEEVLHLTYLDQIEKRPLDPRAVAFKMVKYQGPGRQALVSQQAVIVKALRDSAFSKIRKLREH